MLCRWYGGGPADAGTGSQALEMGQVYVPRGQQPRDDPGTGGGKVLRYWTGADERRIDNREADDPAAWPFRAYGCLGGRLGRFPDESAHRRVGPCGLAALCRSMGCLLQRQELPDAVQQAEREKYGYVRAEEMNQRAGQRPTPQVCYL